jgi:RNA polymerase sigma-70 factor, ECF subfamily
MSARVVKIRKAADRDAPWSDDAVAHACLSGDPAAVAELFDRFHLRVTRYLTRAIGNTADVEDLLQATFLEVARGASRFDGRSSVSTWLLGIATNALRHHLRSSSRRRGLLDAVSSERAGASAPSVTDEVDARLALARAQEVLEALPEEQRLAFVLCELEGLRAGEAARLLDTTESAVWKRVSDVRKVVRRALAEGGRT